jgi:hypothetical protein
MGPSRFSSERATAMSDSIQGLARDRPYAGLLQKLLIVLLRDNDILEAHPSFRLEFCRLTVELYVQCPHISDGKHKFAGSHELGRLT